MKSYGEFSMKVSEEDYLANLMFLFFFFPVGYLSVVQIKLQTVTFICNNYTAINLSPLSSKALVFNAHKMMDAY